MIITYIICSCIIDVVLLGIVILSPVYITEGWYWWSVYGTIFILMNGISFGIRMDKWSKQNDQRPTKN